MRSLALLFLLAAANAQAEPKELPLRPVERVDRPEIATSNQATCEPDGVETQRKVIDTTEIWLVHGCASDADSVMVMHTPSGWFESAFETIAYQGANMTEAPLSISLVSERLSTGKLADGTRSVVRSVETLRREIVRKTGQVVSSERRGWVEVCTIGDQPACEHIARTCSSKACPKVRLSSGVLVIGSERMQVYR